MKHGVFRYSKTDFIFLWYLDYLSECCHEGEPGVKELLKRWSNPATEYEIEVALKGSKLVFEMPYEYAL